VQHALEGRGPSVTFRFVNLKRKATLENNIKNDLKDTGF
jgi:hypothetical protein